MKSFALLAVAAVIALPARACLNDRDSDSLATQAAQLPETLRVITGRFERNPPLYYQMRIERERAALAATPKQFGLYDDIGVALDKLGKSDEAIETMNAKRAVLPAFDAGDKANREAWYRTYANEGTFRAHRYLKNWGSYDSLRDRDTDKMPAELSELKNARDQIKRAIEIKPDAHFGRERYQLMAMDWIIARQSGATKKTLGEWMWREDKWEEMNAVKALKGSNRERAVEGLSGLIVLGGAWESPDVFEALGSALDAKDSVTLRFLSYERVKELINNGRPTFWKASKNGMWPSLDYGQYNSGLEGSGIGLRPENQVKLQDLNTRLRAEADSWNTNRQNWMTTKLTSGVHPDTDANFWQGYTEIQPPSLDIKWENNATDAARRARIKTQGMWINGGLILSFIGLLAFIAWRWGRHSQENSTSNSNLIDD